MERELRPNTKEGLGTSQSSLMTERVSCEVKGRLPQELSRCLQGGTAEEPNGLSERTPRQDML